MIGENPYNIIASDQFLGIIFHQNIHHDDLDLFFVYCQPLRDSGSKEKEKIFSGEEKT